MDKRISMAVVGCHCGINKPSSFLLTKNKDEIRGSIKASTQQSAKIYQVSHCDPFLKKMERVMCVRIEDGNGGFFTKSSVSTSVKKAYVHWVFKDLNPIIYSILFYHSAKYCTSPLHHPYNVQPVSRVCGVLLGCHGITTTVPTHTLIFTVVM